jgi:hypothetical protein
MNLKKFRGLCASCGKNEIKAGATKYCSRSCQFDHDFRLRATLLESGLYPRALHARFLKRYLIFKRGEKCSRCGWAERNPRTGKVPVEVEHIDGNGANDSLGNLTLLCPNCHSLTTTFRGLNRGNGRAARHGGRGNPLRPGSPRYVQLAKPSAPFPLPRSLAETVEAKDAAVAADVAEWLKATAL